MTEQTIPGSNVTQLEAPDSPVDMVDFKFRWKKDKLGAQRPMIETKGPTVSTFGIAEIFNKGGKGLDLLKEVAYDTVRSAVADWLGNNESATSDNIPWAQFTWEAIANQPREDRRASSIPEETWKDFVSDYIAIMPGVTNKSEEAVTNATIVYLKKFSMIKSDKASLKKLQDQLALYTEHSKKAEDFSEILELLNKKLKTYLESDDVQLLVANL